MKASAQHFAYFRAVESAYFKVCCLPWRSPSLTGKYHRPENIQFIVGKQANR